jgi:hypothetical protein
MDTNSILVDIAVHDVGAQPVELRSGSWICSIAILPAESSLETTDLTISIAYQPPEDQPDPQHEIDHVDRYTQLRIVKTGCTDPDSLVMMVPIRDPQRLFWGIQGTHLITFMEEKKKRKKKDKVGLSERQVTRAKLSYNATYPFF